MYGDLKEDSGATVVLFALLLGAGVLLGLLALVVDSGQGYQGRRDAQDVADLASLSIAYQCVKNSASCTDQTQVTTIANQVATANAPGKRIYSDVTRVCGISATCPTLTTNRYECRATSAPKFVRVYTRARTAQSTTGIPYFFAPLAGGPTNGAFAGCSQSGWGQVAAAPIQVPIILSICEFHLSVAQESQEWKNEILPASSLCNSGSDFDGLGHTANFRGFMLIKPTDATYPWFDATCAAPVLVKVTDGLTKVASNICTGLGTVSDVLAAMLNKPKIVPVAKVLDGGSAKTTIASFAMYELLGYTLKGVRHGDLSIPWSATCLSTVGNETSGNRCIYGRFLTTVIPYQKINYTVPNLGVNTVTPIP